MCDSSVRRRIVSGRQPTLTELGSRRDLDLRRRHEGHLPAPHSVPATLAADLYDRVRDLEAQLAAAVRNARAPVMHGGSAVARESANSDSNDIAAMFAATLPCLSDAFEEAGGERCGRRSGRATARPEARLHRFR